MAPSLRVRAGQASGGERDDKCQIVQLTSYLSSHITSSPSICTSSLELTQANVKCTFLRYNRIPPQALFDIPYIETRPLLNMLHTGFYLATSKLKFLKERTFETCSYF